MNIYSLIAFVLAGGVFFGSVFTATENTSAFLDWHAALIVFGGTLAVAAISFQIDHLYTMFKVFYYRVIKSHKKTNVGLIKEILAFAEAYRKDPADAPAMIEKYSDPFLKECVTVLTEDYLESETFKRVMEQRIQTIFNRYNDDAKKFKALGKYPPAMGLMGAVLGMIALLQTLGQPGAEDAVGPAMAVAMVATLYGIAFANLVVLPIAENLTEGAKEVYIKNRIILEGVLLIGQRKNKIVMTEELNSFLLPSERIDWKEAVGS